MSKFKVGDKVKIREDLREGYNSPTAIVTDSMLNFAGMIATIKSVDEDGDYQLDVDDLEYFWADTFLEEI